MRFGAFLKGFVDRRRPDAAAVERIRGWCGAGETLPGTTFAINEIACMDPGCPGVETVILVMEPGRKTRAHKLAKPLDAVTEPDVRDAFKA